jgi:integrase
MASLHSKKLPENIRQRGKPYYFRWRDHTGKQRETPLGTDLTATKQTAKKLAARQVDIKAGTAHPDEAKWQEAELRPIREHVADWFDSLKNRGGCDHYVSQTRDRVVRLLDLARIERISGLSVHAIEGAMADLKTIPGRSGNGALGQRSVHHHGRAIKSFSLWLRKAKRSRDDILIDLTLPKVLDTRERKALQSGEVVALIETTRTLPTRAKISGPDRAMLYATAVGTGFRLGELQSLTPESFNLRSDPPTIVCDAAYTKNGKKADQPIREELAGLLRPWLAGKAPGKPVFVLDRVQIARVLRRDLEDAGIAESESYDFHCLRHTYITMVINSGASVKVCQELARHADPKLTMNVYTHLTIRDTAQGLEGLSHTLPTPGFILGHTGTGEESMISSPGLPESVRNSVASKATDL